MTLAPIWRTRFFTAAGAVAAVWLGAEVAQGDLGWPVLLACGLGAILLVWLQPLPLGTLLFSVVLVGYIVGNRGFAQLSLAGGAPLLPAEALLLVAGGVMVVQCAWRHELPFRRDPLNLVLLLWMIVGTGRLLFDVRAFGFMALRDFATVYYAAFFFLAQEAARNPAGRRWLHGTLLVSCALLFVINSLYVQFPDFFFRVLTVRDIPLVYYKGDLAGTFMAMGAVLFFLRFEQRGRWWEVGLSLVLVAGTFASGNRASMLGLVAATLWLAVGGRWRFAAVQAVGGAVAATIILLAIYATGTSWEKTPLYGLYESAISIGDPLGTHEYSGETTSNKGDNNQYRAVWWRAVFDETVENNPYIGLGFGYDLANRFLQEYYPDSNDDFSVRSPHNVLLTIFSRMGVAGLVPFLALIGLMAVRTFRAVRAGPDATAGLWCSAWVILVSACLGVVLEGPMGAVVFWTVLGLAHGGGTPASRPPGAAKPGVAALLRPVPAGEMAVSS